MFSSNSPAGAFETSTRAVGCASAHVRDSFHLILFKPLKPRRLDLVPIANAHPVRRIHPTSDPFEKCRIWPQVRARHQSMLHRIVVDVVEMLFKIALIPDPMLPESLLPYAAKPALAPRFRLLSFDSAALKPKSREIGLDGSQ